MGATGAAPWIRRQRRLRDCLRRGAFKGLERVELLLLQLIMGVLLRRRRRPRAWTPTPASAMAGQWVRSRRGSRRTRFVVCSTRLTLPIVKEWAVNEVGRVADALVGLSLPFDPGNIAPTLTALDRAVFNAPVAITPPIDLVAADVTQGNGGWWVRNGWRRE